MASAEHEPIMGVWGRARSGIQGQSPWSGGQSPPEAESILVIGCPTEPANLAPFQKCPFELRYMQQSITTAGSELRSTGVRVGGGAECMVPSNPVIGGCLRRPPLRRQMLADDPCWCTLVV